MASEGILGPQWAPYEPRFEDDPSVAYHRTFYGAGQTPSYSHTVEMAPSGDEFDPHFVVHARTLTSFPDGDTNESRRLMRFRTRGRAEQAMGLVAQRMDVAGNPNTTEKGRYITGPTGKVTLKYRSAEEG